MDSSGLSRHSSSLPQAMTDPVTRPSIGEIFNSLEGNEEEFRKISILWLGIGAYSFATSLLGLLTWLNSVPFFRVHLTLVVTDLLSLLIAIVAVPLFGYLALISNYLPSKLVGRYVKHGFELSTLVAAFITQLVWGYDALDLLTYSGFIGVFHAYFRLQRHPADLGWRDWILEEAMQVAVYVCTSNKQYAIVNLVAWIMIIGYRSCSYAYPQVSSDYPPLLA